MSSAVVDETSGRNSHRPRLQSPENIPKLSNHGYSLSFSGSQSCLEHLIEHFGDHIIHLRDEKQRTPLHIAALHGHAECASMLLNLGAAPLVVDSEGRTPLIAAAQYGQSNVVELLLSCKIDLSACDNDGNTALHWACLRKHHQTALLILESCQDAKIVDVSNNEKKTPLHLAARNGLVDVTRELLKKGANVLAIDNEGLTPALSCAPNNNVAHCLALILQMLPDCLDKANKSNASNTNLDQSNAMRMALKDSMSSLPGLKELKGLDSNHSSDNEFY
ncbi:hypothetical protein D910_05198 [Dendroctonus ponderosae]|uniref:Uncharacterized protein n=1 Tax=Dendroctonus ponderosae TaxID=77166 RepID=U4U1S1_DENPD|nr:hypothetical protein D910_05198 [Dendroctonus ponderosae]